MKNILINIGLICLLLLTSLSCQKQEPIGLNITNKYLNGDIYMGQKISILKNNRDFSDNESVSGFSGKLEGNPYFDYVSFNSDRDHRFFDLRSTLEHMHLGQSQIMPDSTDSLQLQIIWSCIDEFGEDFKIYKRRPTSNVIVLVWDLDSVFVAFDYRPFISYRDDLKDKKELYNGYGLEISINKLDWISYLEETNEWTKSYFLNKKELNSD